MTSRVSVMYFLPGPVFPPSTVLVLFEIPSSIGELNSAFFFFLCQSVNYQQIISTVLMLPSDLFLNSKREHLLTELALTGNLQVELIDNDCCLYLCFKLKCDTATGIKYTCGVINVRT